MKQDEAFKKWCPFARVVDSYQGQVFAGNRTIDGEGTNGSECLGDDCACWHSNSPTSGHCGLANR